MLLKGLDWINVNTYYLIFVTQDKCVCVYYYPVIGLFLDLEQESNVVVYSAVSYEIVWIFPSHMGDGARAKNSKKARIVLTYVFTINIELI